MKAFAKTSIGGLRWERTFIDALPADPITDNYVRQVRNACYSYTKPQLFKAPSLMILSMSVCRLLNIPEELTKTDEFLKIFTGQEPVPDIPSWSCCYAGHQFGSFAGQLGDGRAITIGELRNDEGNLFDIQLKGSGKTPYSRHADGKAVLRSCIREYLASEAFFYLGIPTTRALGVFLTGEKVIRDILYDGNPAPEPGAILCRVSESLIRFGNFEMFYWQDKHEITRQLLEYVIARNFKELQQYQAPERYLKFLEKVVSSTAQLIAKWQSVGFVHGVMNTDNMSVLGETIDFGPFGFVEEFDPKWTPNTTDNDSRRYTYESQPDIGLWNLMMLGNSLLPIVEDVDKVKDILKGYRPIFDNHYLETFKKKIGLVNTDDETAAKLIKDLMTLLESSKLDMTIFFRKFADFNIFEFESNDFDKFLDSISDSFYNFSYVQGNLKQWNEFLVQYKHSLISEKSDFASRKQLMDSVNPRYILRNWQLQECILQAEKGNFDMLNEIDRMIRTPFTEQAEFEKYFQKRPDWAKRLPGYSMLSCSS